MVKVVGGVGRLEQLLADGCISEALNDRLEAGRRVIHNPFRLLPQLFRLLLRSYYARTVQVHQNTGLIVADEAEALAYRLSRGHTLRRLLA